MFGDELRVRLGAFAQLSNRLAASPFSGADSGCLGGGSDRLPGARARFVGVGDRLTDVSDPFTAARGHLSRVSDRFARISGCLSPASDRLPRVNDRLLDVRCRCARCMRSSSACARLLRRCKQPFSRCARAFNRCEQPIIWLHATVFGAEREHAVLGNLTSVRYNQQNDRPYERGNSRGGKACWSTNARLINPLRSEVTCADSDSAATNKTRFNPIVPPPPRS
jgi:hypothetical protein